MKDYGLIDITFYFIKHIAIVVFHIAYAVFRLMRYLLSNYLSNHFNKDHATVDSYSNSNNRTKLGDSNGSDNDAEDKDNYFIPFNNHDHPKY